MSSTSAPMVTLGYLIAGAFALALWFGVGVLLLPIMLAMALFHALAKNRQHPLAASHHRWLAAHHLGSVIVLLAVLILPLLSIPALISDATTVMNTLSQSPHPLETLSAAWPSFNHLPTLIASGLIFVFGWFVAVLWISFRLLRRGLRWAEGLSAY